MSEATSLKTWAEQHGMEIMCEDNSPHGSAVLKIDGQYVADSVGSRRTEQLKHAHVFWSSDEPSDIAKRLGYSVTHGGDWGDDTDVRRVLFGPNFSRQMAYIIPVIVVDCATAVRQS